MLILYDSNQWRCHVKDKKIHKKTLQSTLPLNTSREKRASAFKITSKENIFKARAQSYVEKKTQPSAFKITSKHITCKAHAQNDGDVLSAYRGANQYIKVFASI